MSRSLEKLRTLAHYELKNLVSGTGARVALGLVLAAGLYAVYYGKAEIDEQRRVIRLLPGLQAEIDRAYVLARFKPVEHSGRYAFYLTAPTAHEPSPWAALSIGQRDLNPYVLGVRLLGLQSQLYDSGMENPLKALSGNFDLAFVLVFLFPLLIIGLSYSLVSGEEDQGTLRLLRSLGTPLLELVAVKLAVRFILVLSLAAALLAAGLAWAGIGLSGLTGAWLAVIAAYFAFWFGATFFVVSLRRSSAFNATCLLGVWLMLTVVLPALLNVGTSAYFPVPHAYEVAVQHRNEVNAGWDRPKEATFGRFFRTHPEWAGTPPVTGAFAWKWYYAMQQAADDHVATLAGAYLDHLLLRQDWARGLALLSPPVAAQLMLNQLAQTDLDAHIGYLRGVARAHEGLKRLLYPMVFGEVELAPRELGTLRVGLPPGSYEGSGAKRALPQGFAELALSALLLFAISPWLLRRQDLERA